MEIEVKPMHPLNALSPIDVTELGIIVFLHPKISVFVAVSIIALQLSRESYLLLPLSTVIDVKLGQATKNALPIEVTELEIAIEVKLEQPRNARLPIEVTELGIFIEVKPWQSEKA